MRAVFMSYCYLGHARCFHRLAHVSILLDSDGDRKGLTLALHLYDLECG